MEQQRECNTNKMSVNSSSASPPPEECFTSSRTVLILIAFFITNILLILPVCTFILCLGLRRWRQQRSSSASHTDVFTYQMAGMELLGLLGWFLFSAGVCTHLQRLATCGLYTFFSTWCVKIHFHTLTCVERYLAVVHPVTYLGLKSRGRIRIRNRCAGCLWLLCLMEGVLVSQAFISISIEVYSVFVLLALIIICFCCGSVLRALRRPRPGREGADPAKQRAFVTVVSIMGALWVCLVGMLVCIAVVQSHTLSDSDGCSARAAAVWFSLPSSLVLPVLYLHRAGKLPGCK